MESWERLRQDAEPPQFEEYGVPELAQRWFFVAMGQYIYNDAHGLWLEPAAQDGHSDPGALAYTLGERMSALTQLYNGGITESPIEEMLLGALMWLQADWAGFPRADYLDGPTGHLEIRNGGPDEGVEFNITPQAKVGDYRADFLLWFAHKTHFAGVAVECDGHAFHEKTKEQAARDKARDRAFLTAGFPVMRFAGSEIFKDPMACAAQVRLALQEPLDRISRKAGLYT